MSPQAEIFSLQDSVPSFAVCDIDEAKARDEETTYVVGDVEKSAISLARRMKFAVNAMTNSIYPFMLMLGGERHCSAQALCIHARLHDECVGHDPSWAVVDVARRKTATLGVSHEPPESWPPHVVIKEDDRAVAARRYGGVRMTVCRGIGLAALRDEVLTHDWTSA